MMRTSCKAVVQFLAVGLFLFWLMDSGPFHEEFTRRGARTGNPHPDPHRPALRVAKRGVSFSLSTGTSERSGGGGPVLTGSARGSPGSIPQ